MATATFPLAPAAITPADVESASAGTDGGAEATDIIANTEHENEGVARLLEQFKNKPRIESIVRALMGQVQDLEDALMTALLERFLADTTIGVQLDGIGQIVGQARSGLSDDDYRVYLRARILINLSDGQPEELITILQTMLSGSDVEIIETFPAELRILLTPELTISPSIPNSAMQTARAAAVRLLFEYTLTAITDVFSYGAVGDYPETDADRGFDNGSSPDTTGGYYAGVLDQNAPRIP
jgi:hypothetical protein